MKIIFCDNSLKELLNFRGDVIQHYINKGCGVILIAPVNISTDNLTGMNIININLDRGGMNPFHDLSFMWQLLKIYKHERPDIIFHYTIKPNIYGSIAAKILSIPSVAMIAGLGYTFFHSGIKTRLARLMYKVAMHFPKRIFVLNESNMKRLIDQRIINPDKTVLLEGGEGINLDNFK